MQLNVTGHHVEVTPALRGYVENMLEDLGFYCIDNIPAALLKPFISYTVRSPEPTYERTAIGLDARNTAAEIATVPQLIDELRRGGIQCEVIFLLASEEELLRRF